MVKTSSKVTQITVFTDRAQIQRSAKEKLTKGEHLLLFDDLPQDIEQNSIQVNGEGKALIKDVKFKTKELSQIPEANFKILYNKRLELEDSLKDLNNKIEHARKEKQFVEKIAERLTHATEKSAPLELNPDKWVKMVGFYRMKQDQLDIEISEVEKGKRIVKDELDKTVRQINGSGSGGGKSKNQVEVILEMKEEGSIKLDLSYIVYGPGWYPVYDLRVSTKTKKMNITYNALVQQDTGEAWDNVHLMLSTAQPNISGQQPELTPWHLNIYYPEVYKSNIAAPAPSISAKRKESKAQMFAGSAEGEADEIMDASAIAEPEMEIPETVVETKATSVVFAVSGTNTIKDDNLPHKVTIMVNEFPAQFRYSTVPKLAPYAYLKAKVKNKTDYPFLEGESNVFLDSNFVANARLDLIAPDEEFWTFLGVDEGMKVEHKFLKKYQKDEGVFAKKNKFIYEYQIQITSNKKSEEELVVWDQFPISNSQEIEVELLDPQYKKDSPSLKKNEYNYLEWFFKVKPAQKIKIPFKFSVSYPRDKTISGL
ncbi:MAG: mucoidy inhibitor MuiA family protein [Spirochaetes bacterium]|nr:mucoidy inhibitor MuiA family protein [Spirochaetota bacterium]